MKNYFRFKLLLIFTISVLSNAALCANKLPIADQLKNLVPGADLYPRQIAKASNGELSVSSFDYKLKHSEKDYGTVVAVSETSSNELLWVYFVYGDFGPHTINLIDFDGDHKDDLWILSGFEDVFASHLFMNRIEQSKFSMINFVPGFGSEDVYATLIDINKDGYPEILTPENNTFGDIWENYEISEAQCFRLSEEIIDSAKTEYARIVGEFDFANFDYNMDSYPVHALFVNNKIQIFSRYPKNEIVTNRYADHLNWRTELINKRITESEDGCKEVLSQRLE